MDTKAKKKKKQTKTGHVNTSFDDVDIKPVSLHRETDLASPSMPCMNLAPQMNLYELEEPHGNEMIGNPGGPVGVNPGVDPSRTYAVVDKLKKKPKVEANTGGDGQTYIVNKQKKQLADDSLNQDIPEVHVNVGFEADSVNTGDGLQGEGNQMAEQQPHYADVDEQGEGEQMEESRPEFATYAEVGEYGARPTDTGKTDNKTKPDKKKTKKSDKADKKSKSNPFARNKKNKSDKGKDAKITLRPSSHAYDDIDIEFQQRDTSQTHTGLTSPTCLSKLPNSGGSESRGRATPVAPNESSDNVYNRLNFPMLRKGASSFESKPQNETYDCVKLDKYHDVQLENPYEGYDDTAAGSNSVDIDNPYSEAAPVSNKDGGGESLYDEALAVSGNITWDDGPEEFL
jgi:hypothetical protein